ncbi:hypothetical protein DID75_05600 [Candidatus Marinamargulisbacteria bacterium SCGC AG-410-N11]|nr:hypothetical protein DID75_05600 [Candidatus Marinamargulisbacteria bacterium SCGC AG-410-N11]
MQKKTSKDVRHIKSSKTKKEVSYLSKELKKKSLKSKGQLASLIERFRKKVTSSSTANSLEIHLKIIEDQKTENSLSSSIIKNQFVWNQYRQDLNSPQFKSDINNIIKLSIDLNLDNKTTIILLEEAFEQNLISTDSTINRLTKFEIIQHWLQKSIAKIALIPKSKKINSKKNELIQELKQNIQQIYQESRVNDTDSRVKPALLKKRPKTKKKQDSLAFNRFIKSIIKNMENSYVEPYSVEQKTPIISCKLDYFISQLKECSSPPPPALHTLIAKFDLKHYKPNKSYSDYLNIEDYQQLFQLLKNIKIPKQMKDNYNELKQQIKDKIESLSKEFRSKQTLTKAPAAQTIEEKVTPSSTSKIINNIDQTINYIQDITSIPIETKQKLIEGLTKMYTVSHLRNYSSLRNDLKKIITNIPSTKPIILSTLEEFVRLLGGESKTKPTHFQPKPIDKGLQHLIDIQQSHINKRLKNGESVEEKHENISNKIDLGLELATQDFKSFNLKSSETEIKNIIGIIIRNLAIVDISKQINVSDQLKRLLTSNQSLNMSPNYLQKVNTFFDYFKTIDFNLQSTTSDIGTAITNIFDCIKRENKEHIFLAITEKNLDLIQSILSKNPDVIKEKDLLKTVIKTNNLEIYRVFLDSTIEIPSNDDHPLKLLITELFKSKTCKNLEELHKMIMLSIERFPDKLDYLEFQDKEGKNFLHYILDKPSLKEKIIYDTYLSFIKMLDTFPEKTIKVLLSQKNKSCKTPLNIAMENKVFLEILLNINKEDQIAKSHLQHSLFNAIRLQIPNDLSGWYNTTNPVKPMMLEQLSLLEKKLTEFKPYKFNYTPLEFNLLQRLPDICNSVKSMLTEQNSHKPYAKYLGMPTKKSAHAIGVKVVNLNDSECILSLFNRGYMSSIYLPPQISSIKAPLKIEQKINNHSRLGQLILMIINDEVTPEKLRHLQKKTRSITERSAEDKTEQSHENTLDIKIKDWLKNKTKPTLEDLYELCFSTEFQKQEAIKATDSSLLSHTNSQNISTHSSTYLQVPSPIAGTQKTGSCATQILDMLVYDKIYELVCNAFTSTLDIDSLEHLDINLLLEPLTPKLLDPRIGPQIQAIIESNKDDIQRIAKVIYDQFRHIELDTMIMQFQKSQKIITDLPLQNEGTHSKNNSKLAQINATLLDQQLSSWINHAKRKTINRYNRFILHNKDQKLKNFIDFNKRFNTFQTWFTDDLADQYKYDHYNHISKQINIAFKSLDEDKKTEIIEQFPHLFHPENKELKINREIYDTLKNTKSLLEFKTICHTLTEINYQKLFAPR